MQIRFFLLSLFCILIISVRAQQKTIFTGAVINENNTPLPGSSIYILNKDLGTNADEKGNFIFPDLPEGKYEIQVSSIGYATLNSTVNISKNISGPIKFTLQNASKQLDAVFVSAQKTEEFLQKVPLSITALSSRQVAEFRLWNSEDLTAIIPNLYAANSGDDRNVTSIRGITTTSYDPAVTTYIDGVNQFSLDTYIAQLTDIERIEVLRGPQGTLYGRNAMAGVINIITKQPGNKMTGFIEMSMGDYDQLRTSAGLRFPVIKNTLFVGISAAYSKRNGYYTNDFYNNSFDKQSVVSNNYYIKYYANKKLHFTLNAKHQNNRNNGAFPLVNGVDEALDNPFHLNQDATAKMIDNTFNISLVTTYSGKKINFSSQSSYQSNRRYYDKPLDADFSPIDGVTVINNFENKWNKVQVFTQEFKLNSPATSAKRVKWTVGSYLFFQNNPVKQAIHFGKDAAFVGAPDTNFSLISTTKGKNSGIALFGQSTITITKKLNLILGLRYDYEKKKYNVLGEYLKEPFPIFETRPDTSASANFNAFSPKAGLSYSLNKHSDVFITYSRGYRTGGLTALNSDPSQPPLYPYNPEYSNNMEAGIKNSFFQNRLQLNVSLFITKVTDAQVPTLLLPDAVTVTKNAGTLTSKGFEVEIAAKPVKGLQADYNFGYTDARYDKLKLAQNGSTVNLDGKKQIYTPEATSMLALQYSYSFGVKHVFNFISRIEWQYLGNQYFDLSNNIKQSDYSLLNIRFGISSGQTSLMFWARNLGDKKYIAYAYDFGAVHLGNPRTIGFTLSTAF